MYSQNDWRDYLAHNWGNSPKMKAAEKIYNAKYYQEHKAKLLARAKERAGDIAEGAKNVAKDVAKDWASKNGAVSKEYAERQKRRMDEYANGKTKDQLKNDYEYNSRKRSYEGQLEAYYKTPLGKLERAASAGKSAVSSGKSAMEKAKKRVNKAKSAYRPFTKEERANFGARQKALVTPKKSSRSNKKKK